MWHLQSKATLASHTPAYLLIKSSHGQHRDTVWVGVPADSIGSTSLCGQVLGSPHATLCAGRLWAVLGLHDRAGSSRLVEERSSGVGHPSWLLRVRGLQPRGCTQAFCPPHFGVRQARVVVVLGVFPCRVWCGIPSWLVSAAAARSARKTRGLATLLVWQSI